MFQSHAAGACEVGTDILCVKDTLIWSNAPVELMQLDMASGP